MRSFFYFWFPPEDFFGIGEDSTAAHVNPLSILALEEDADEVEILTIFLHEFSDLRHQFGRAIRDLNLHPVGAFGREFECFGYIVEAFGRWQFPTRVLDGK